MCATASLAPLQHSTAEHSRAQHSTAEYGTAQPSPAQHSTAQHSTAQLSSAQLRLLKISVLLRRRGAKEADELILELVRIIDAVKGDTCKHMAHEEQEVLPLLEAHLCAAEQRAMVWRTLRAMPLRLLERVMPWVAGNSCCAPLQC